MATLSSSKYLQLPDEASSDIGKPSPLAMLAATCQKIGASSRVSSLRVMRTPPPQPKTTPLPHTPVSTSMYHLPPTPPPSPPMQIAVTPSSPALSISPQPTDLSPLPLRSVSPVITGHQTCYPLYQPVMRYSPYSTTPPSRPRKTPSPMSYQPVTTPYSPCTPMMVPVPVINHMNPCYNTLLHPHSSSLPPMFGVYPHHDQHDQPVHARMSSLKVRSTRNRQSRRLDSEDVEEIIDVVSL